MTEPGYTTSSEHDQAGADPQRRPVASGGRAVAAPPLDTAPGVAPAAASTDDARSAAPVIQAPSPAIPPARGDHVGSPRDPAAKAEEEQPFWRWLLEFVVLVGLAVLLATGIKTFVVQPFFIPSGSMIPTLEINDRVLVNKFVYRFSEPGVGDVVVFSGPGQTDEDLIKRVIAVGGQTVDIRDGYVLVDGKKLDEPYVKPSDRDRYNLPGPLKIPAGFLWLMGDNRANSADSRVFGPQPVSKVLGQAFMIYWPLERMRGL